MERDGTRLQSHKGLPMLAHKLWTLSSVWAANREENAASGNLCPWTAASCPKGNVFKMEDLITISNVITLC